MGLETAAIVMSVVAVGAEVAKAGSEVASANKQDEALDLQAKEMQLQTQQKTLKNYDVMQKVLEAQEAHMTVTGAAFSSPSYNAIQRNTLNIGAKEGKNIELEGELEQENIKTEKANVRNSLYAELFGDAAQTALSTAGIYSKIPTVKS